MHYFYQPHYYQSPYIYTAYQPVARNQVVNPMYQPSNPMHANHLQYVVQHPGVPEHRSQNPQPLSRSPYPPVDPELLYESAIQSNKLMKEASMVLDKLASSMDVAQQSNSQEVERLIHSVGITSDVEIKYNPDGLELEFKSKVKNLDCCKLSISLRWR